MGASFFARVMRTAESHWTGDDCGTSGAGCTERSMSEESWTEIRALARMREKAR